MAVKATKAVKLSALEKSHLVSLASGEQRTVRTVGDIKALNKLVKLGLAKVGSYDEAEGDADGWSVTLAGKKWTRVATNVFTKAQIDKLHKRIAKGKPWVPKVGDLVYMRTMMSIDHGWDDVEGGLAQVKKVYHSMSGGDPKCVFIEICQHDRGGNWTQFLCPEQKELMKRHGLGVAYPDPDTGSSGASDW